MIAGLTGGIGSGKSMVAGVFEILGCAVFHSDEVAKDVYFDPEIRLMVIDLLGPDAYSGGSGINRAYISNEVFRNTHLLHQLNSIIHPAVGRRFEKFCAANKNRIIIKETALLFEAGIAKNVDSVVVVASDDELRIERVMKRDGITREDVIKRMKAQLPQEEKIRKADHVIWNNEEKFLITQTLAIFEKLSGAGSDTASASLIID